MKLISWNVNGLRAALGKGFLDFCTLAEADVYCLQETKMQQVLLPLSEGKNAVYRPWCCKSQSFGAAITATVQDLMIVEGSYCLHPVLRDRYDITVFLTTSPEEQRRRLLQRSADRYLSFAQEWIPKEEAYFEALDLAHTCDFYLET